MWYFQQIAGNPAIVKTRKFINLQHIICRILLQIVRIRRKFAKHGHNNKQKYGLNINYWDCYCFSLGFQSLLVCVWVTKNIGIHKNKRYIFTGTRNCTYVYLRTAAVCCLNLSFFILQQNPTWSCFYVYYFYVTSSAFWSAMDTDLNQFGHKQYVMRIGDERAKFCNDFFVVQQWSHSHCHCIWVELINFEMQCLYVE